MDATNEQFAMAVEQALENLRGRPKSLKEIVEFVAGSNDFEVHDALPRLVQHLKLCGPNDRLRHVITRKLQWWDHEESPDWATGTSQHSIERRNTALRLLGFQKSDFATVCEAIPQFTETEVPIVIAKAHERWYESRKQLLQGMYWRHYEAQLAKPKGTWDSEAVAALDLSTDDVLSRLSDPARAEIHQVKGLVMGYVQSGKTSHFSGLIAKAADSGYRLIVVLAGTMDILRQQTQRRVDKEIVGKELLGPDEYGSDSDWSSFVEHGGRPSENGYFDWERLTNKAEDYSELLQHLSLLDSRRIDSTKPFNHPINLNAAPARLAVIKKTPGRIEQLCKDLVRLKSLRTALEQVPTLVIDDESDQASINTIDQRKPGKAKSRTSTSSAIASLLRLLPRAQYVGYTATPFANVFVDPDDADGLFPKDFIVSLPRPIGYMGVSDFYDFDTEFKEDDERNNRKAYVRPVEGSNQAEKNLPEAIDSFVLSGAIKLFRQAAKPKRYKFRHHTMLVHHSAKKVVHDAEAQEVRAIFKGGSRYQKKSGIDRLRLLFLNDFARVSRVRAPDEVFPNTFDDLLPFISLCVTRICDDQDVLIVNGDNKDDTPDFDQKPVWAILVGGTKLSRGYTVEGLTTSYYRRPAGAGDTLMQMGRWFGFRPGYRDLVRLYIGKNEPRGKLNIDLYEAFGGVCRDEEALRVDLLKYAKQGLRPEQVPPLVRQHLPYLRPTSSNKMFNAEIRALDYAGAWTEKTSAPVKRADMKFNLDLARRLVLKAELGKLEQYKFINDAGTARKFQTYSGSLGCEAIVEFLSGYRWSEHKQSVKLEVDYIRSQLEAGKLAKWVVLLPQTDLTAETRLDKSLPRFTAVGRSRVSDTRFGAYSEPRHRDAASYIAGVAGAQNVSMPLGAARNGSSAVLIMYLVEDLTNPAADLSVGFGIQFPGTKITNAITWSVVDQRKAGDVVIEVKK